MTVRNAMLVLFSLIPVSLFCFDCTDHQVYHCICRQGGNVNPRS